MNRRLAAILAADVVGYSRLMTLNEAGTLATLKAHREELIDPAIAEHHGRIVKLMGDGALVEFASVVDAVTCAIAIQTGMPKRNEEVPEDRRMQFRIGVHLGDVIVEGDDIYGGGVNVAARLEALAEPGGICLSQQAYDQVESKIDVRFVDLGERKIKNIIRPVHVYAIRFHDGPASTAGASEPSRRLHQTIRFCTAADGTRIAYATVGQGPPLVKAPNWMSHLEFEWESPIWGHFMRELAVNHTLVRFDQRGNGLSDWDVEDISFEAFVDDLEVVVEALKLEQFPLLGVSQGCAISIAYAVRHPERVRQLILYGGFIRGAWKRGPAAKEESEAVDILIKHGWGQDNPHLRQMYTSSLIPNGTKEQMEWYNELQRISASAHNAFRLRRAFSIMDVTELLPRVTAPTLVLNARNDAIAPFEEGRSMAAVIPNARFVALEGKNHLLLENEPAWPHFLQEVRNFLSSSS